MGIKDIFNSVGGGVDKVNNSLSNVFGKTVTYTAPVQPKIDRQKFLDAIGSNETSIIKGDPYVSYQPSGSKDLGNALGRYRVTEGELKTYGKRYLGQDITPQQFLASKEYQDNYLFNKAQALALQGYTPQDIADIHNKGIKKSYPAGSGKYQNPDYVTKFNLNYNK